MLDLCFCCSFFFWGGGGGYFVVHVLDLMLEFENFSCVVFFILFLQDMLWSCGLL